MTVRPDYEHDTDETLIYHDGDSMSVTFFSTCDLWPITQAAGALTLFEVDVLELNWPITIPAFTTAGYDNCVQDCE